MPRTAFLHSGLILLGAALVGLPAATASAATPTYYNNQATFQGGLTQSVTDDYSNPGYVFLQNNAAMSAVVGESDYESTGHNNLNIVSGGYYCAGCNGSFRLTFTTTSVGTAQGVDAIGFTIPIHDQGTPYFAYITFADGDHANIQLPTAGNFWGVSAPQQITNIHFGLTMGGTTTGGSFGIDNLKVGSMSFEPECMVDAECPSDGDDCTDEVCSEGFCDAVFNQAPCDDADACTELDTCSQGECVGSDLDCNDQNMCSMDSCDSQIGCVNDLIAGCCTSDADCMDGEICLLGSNSCIPDPNPDTGSDRPTRPTRPTRRVTRPRRMAARPRTATRPRMAGRRRMAGARATLGPARAGPTRSATTRARSTPSAGPCPTMAAAARSRVAAAGRWPASSASC